VFVLRHQKYISILRFANKYGYYKFFKKLWHRFYAFILKPTKMIDQSELPEYISKDIPELSAICQAEPCKNAYSVVRLILNFTKQNVIQHNVKVAKKCLQVAEKLYKKGNGVVKNAIENVFIYSFSHTFFHNDEERKEMMAMVPDSLYKVYVQQMLSSHL